MANTLNLFRHGAVGFIVWLGERRLFLGVLSFLFGWRCVSLRFNLLRDLLAAFLRKLLLFGVEGTLSATSRSFVASFFPAAALNMNQARASVSSFSTPAPA